VKVKPGEIKITSKGFAKRCGLREYELSFAVFHWTIILVVGPMVGLEDYLRWKLDVPDWPLNPKHNPGGLTLYKAGQCPIVWLPRRPVTAREHGFLAHEMLHAIGYLVQHIGIELNDATEEVFCYSLGHGVEEALRQMGIK